MRITRPPLPRLPALLLLAASWLAPPPAGAEPLAQRLHDLAAAHGFRVERIERIADEPAPASGGDLAQLLRGLLVDYDHVVETGPAGVERVIVLGRKQERPAATAIETERRGSHHVVRATLEGAPGRRVTVALVVDTGASTMVLPASMMTALGFRADALADRPSQTVNGIVTGKTGTLRRVVVGGAEARDVDVLFIPDDRLGGVSLLGMSFLERFALSISDVDNRLVLEPR